jgi:hypothetical protein
MTRRIYQNGYADGGIVPKGIHNVSSFPKAPDESKKRVDNNNYFYNIKIRK